MIESVTLAVQLGLAIIAVTEAIKKATNGKVSGWVTIVLAGGLGLTAGIVGMFFAWTFYAGLDPLTGLMVGLAASGGMTLFETVGKATGKAISQQPNIDENKKTL